MRRRDFNTVGAVERTDADRIDDGARPSRLGAACVQARLPRACAPRAIGGRPDSPGWRSGDANRCGGFGEQRELAVRRRYAGKRLTTVPSRRGRQFVRERFRRASVQDRLDRNAVRERAPRTRGETTQE